MNDNLHYLGAVIPKAELHRLAEVKDFLESAGPSDKNLFELYSHLLDTYDNTFIWRIPISTDVYTGGAIVPVREGFLWLPYESVMILGDEPDGCYTMSEAQLLDGEMFGFLVSEFRDYTHGLEEALNEVGKLLGSPAESSPEWFLTDPDTRQYCAIHAQHLFEFVDTRLDLDKGNNVVTKVCRKMIDLTEFTDAELLSFTSAYYPSIGRIFFDYGADAAQIIAECIFESIPLQNMDEVVDVADLTGVVSYISSVIGRPLDS